MTIKWKEATRSDPCGSLRNMNSRKGNMNSRKQQKALRKSRQTTFLNEYFSESGLFMEEPESEGLCPCGDGSNVVEKW